jgi:hypothetical protein
MSLLDDMNAARAVLREKQHDVKVAEAYLSELEMKQMDCKHVWGNPYPGYEHEGRHCTECGINDMYFDTLKKFVYGKKST